MNVDSCNLEPEKQKANPCIDLTLEDELSRMTLSEQQVMIDIKKTR